MSKQFLSGFRNTNCIIYDYLDPKSLYNVVKTCKCPVGMTEEYFKKRIEKFYGLLATENKPEKITFRQQYSDIVRVFEYCGFVELNDKYVARLDILILAEKMYHCPCYNPTSAVLYADLPTLEQIVLKYRFKLDQCLIQYAIGNLEIYNYLIYEHHLHKVKLSDVFKEKNLDNLDKTISLYRLEIDCRSLLEAIGTGSVETIKWLIEKFGLKKFYKSRYGKRYRERYMQRVMKLGSIEMFELFIKLGWKVNRSNLNNCVAHGHFKLAEKIMAEYNLTPQLKTTKIAYHLGNLPALEYLWHNFKFSPSTFIYSKNVKILEWSTQFGYCPNQETVNWACCCCHFDVVVWCFEKYNLAPNKVSILNMICIDYHTQLDKLIKYLCKINRFDIHATDFGGERLYTFFKHLEICQPLAYEFQLKPNFNILCRLVNLRKFHILHWIKSAFTSIYQDWVTEFAT